MTKLECLEILGLHKDRLKAKYEQPGWTIWALYGALASLIWLLVECYTKQSGLTKESILIFCGFLLVKPSIYIFKISLTPQQPIRKRFTSLRWLVKNSFISLVYYLICYGFMFIYLWQMRMEFPPTIRVAFILLISFGALVVLLVILLLIVNFHVTLGAKKKKRYDIGGEILYLFLATTSLFTMVGIYLNIEDNLNDYSIKLGLVFIGLYFVIGRLLSDPNNRPLINTLDELMIDVTLDRKRPEEAIEKLKLIILGLNFRDLMSNQLVNHIDMDRKFNYFCKSISEQITEYRNASEEKRTELLNKINMELRVLRNDIVPKLIETREKIHKRLTLYKTSLENEEEYQSIVEEMRNRENERFKYYDELISQINELSNP